MSDNRYYNANLIVPYLYLGSMNVADNIFFLKEKKIVGVLSILNDHVNLNIKALYKQIGIQHLHLQCNDVISANIKQFFDKSFSFIDSFVQSHKYILVHCAAGISRSATLVINYLIRCAYLSRPLHPISHPRKLTYEDAISFVRLKRSCICPNDGFLQQIIDEEKRLVSSCDVIITVTPNDARSILETMKRKDKKEDKKEDNSNKKEEKEDDEPNMQ